MLPAQLRSAAAPAVLGLRLARGAVWAAAVVLSAAGLRAGCFQLADAGLLAAARSVGLFAMGIPGLGVGTHAGEMLPARGRRPARRAEAQPSYHNLYFTAVFWHACRRAFQLADAGLLAAQRRAAYSAERSCA